MVMSSCMHALHAFLTHALFLSAIFLPLCTFPSKTSLFPKVVLCPTCPQHWNLARPEPPRLCALPQKPLLDCGTCLPVLSHMFGPARDFPWVILLLALWSPPGSLFHTLPMLFPCYPFAPLIVWSIVLLGLEEVPSAPTLLSIFLATSSCLVFPWYAWLYSLFSAYAWGPGWLCLYFLILGPTDRSFHIPPMLSIAAMPYKTSLQLCWLMFPFHPFVL